ncbi:MAG: ParB N-terminal domain-containing protein [Nitrosopumilus sp.]
MMSEIFETKDYEKFKRLEGNRKINSTNLKNLSQAIQKHNRLSYHPIITSKDMYVIDGHHRLKVAEELEYPVFYIVDPTVTMDEMYDHILSANVNKKNWSLEDFFNLYAKKDANPHYIEFLDLMKVLDLKPKALLGLICASYNGEYLDLIKKGHFTLPIDKIAFERITLAFLQLKQFVQERKIKPYSMFSSAYFTNAFRILMNNSSFEVDLFFQKLENLWHKLKPQSCPKEWLAVLTEIYNWKNHNKIVVE